VFRQAGRLPKAIAVLCWLAAAGVLLFAPSPSQGGSWSRLLLPVGLAVAIHFVLIKRFPRFAAQCSDPQAREPLAFRTLFGWFGVAAALTGAGATVAIAEFVRSVGVFSPEGFFVVWVPRILGGLALVGQAGVSLRCLTQVWQQISEQRPRHDAWVEEQRRRQEAAAEGARKRQQREMAAKKAQQATESALSEFLDNDAGKQPSDDIDERYLRFCEEKGAAPVSMTEFHEAIAARRGRAVDDFLAMEMIVDGEPPLFEAYDHWAEANRRARCSEKVYHELADAVRSAKAGFRAAGFLRDALEHRWNVLQSEDFYREYRRTMAAAGAMVLTREEFLEQINAPEIREGINRRAHESVRAFLADTALIDGAAPAYDAYLAWARDRDRPPAMPDVYALKANEQIVARAESRATDFLIDSKHRRLDDLRSPEFYQEYCQHAASQGEPVVKLRRLRQIIRGLSKPSRSVGPCMACNQTGRVAVSHCRCGGTGTIGYRAPSTRESLIWDPFNNRYNRVVHRDPGGPTQCPDCGGTGGVKVTETCPHCSGTGKKTTHCPPVLLPEGNGPQLPRLRS